MPPIPTRSSKRTRNSYTVLIAPLLSKVKINVPIVNDMKRKHAAFPVHRITFAYELVQLHVQVLANIVHTQTDGPAAQCLRVGAMGAMGFVGSANDGRL